MRPGRSAHRRGVAAAHARVLVADAAAEVRLAGADGRYPRASARRTPVAQAGRPDSRPRSAAAAARRPPGGGRASRAATGGGVRASRPAADVGAGVPGGGVLAARPRGPGAPSGPLGAGPLRIGRVRHPSGAVDRADGPGAGRRARALGPRRARPRGPAARHPDDRLLPGAHLVHRSGHPGARDPAGHPGRRAACPRSRRAQRHPGAGGADRARGPGARGRRGHGARRAQSGTAGPHAAHGV